MMAKKMYLSASSMILQADCPCKIHVFHATVRAFTENYCDLEAEGKIDMFMLGQRIILIFPVYF